MDRESGVEALEQDENVRATELGDLYLADSLEAILAEEVQQPERTTEAYERVDIVALSREANSFKHKVECLPQTLKFYSDIEKKQIFFDDKTRANVLQRLILFTFLAENLIAGHVTGNTEIAMAVVPMMAGVQELLLYFYELDCNGGTYEIYNENDTEPLRKQRLKFLMSKHVYDLIDHVQPKLIDTAIGILEKINNSQLEWEAPHAN